MKLQKDFLWKSGDVNSEMHLVAWDLICSLKSKGGLGMRRLTDMNRALLCKWLWWLGSTEDWLW